MIDCKFVFLEKIFMNSYRSVIFLFLFFLFFSSTAQNIPGKELKQAYIEKYKQFAIDEMQLYKIPASITLSQGILESSSGRSDLATVANNHFGIKCHLEWNGPVFFMDDDTKNECFRKYNNPEESYRDHSQFLSSRPRYAALFQLDIKDYKGWAHGLKKAGYATNPNYPELLIKIIEDFRLFELDQITEPESLIASTSPVTEKEVNYRHKKQKEQFKPISITESFRDMFENNGIVFTFAEKEDTPEKIADDFAIYDWQVYKYNDINKSQGFKEGDMVYLQPKKNKCSLKEHVVRQGETLRGISQMYGIKLKKLRKYNGLLEGQEVSPGVKLKLR